MRNMWLYVTIAILLSFIRGAGFAGYDLGQPVALDTRAVTVGSTGWFQSNPAVASSGSIYLAVWADMRDAGRGSDLYATRIAADGTVLDPIGIRLTTNISVCGKPDVCWNGENFFVVFSGAVGTIETKIHAVRVMPNGTVLDNPPIVLNQSVQAINPQVSWDGTRHVVVWQGNSSTAGEGILALYLDRQGTGTPHAWRVCGTSAVGAGPAIASASGGRSLIVWADERNSAGSSTDIYGAFMPPQHWETPNFPICTDVGSQGQPNCCWTGTDYKVVWTSSNQSQNGICGRSVGPDGTVYGAAPWVVSFVASKQSEPQIAWNGTDCLVTWTRRGQALGQLDIYAGRVSTDGNLLDGTGVAVCAADDRQTRPCVTALGSNFLVGWMDSRSTAGPTVPGFGHQIRAVRVAADATLTGSEFALTQSAPQHKISCSAYNGRQFLVCWDEWSSGARNLCGELIDAYTGRPVTTTPFVISPLVVENAFPAATWNGASFVVTWLAGTKVMAARVSPTGATLDPAGIVAYDGGTTPIYVQPAIASDGNRCLITFRTGINARGVLLSHDGSRYLDFVVGAARNTSVHEGTAVCWTGERYIVAWKQQLNTSTTYRAPGGIDYATVTADGVPSTVTRVTDETFPDYFDLACNGQNVLLAAYGPEIRTRRLSLTGTLLDTMPVSIPGSADADSVSLAWNGVSYVLTWMAGGSQDDMLAVRINGDNQLVDTIPIAVTDSAITETGGSMCAGPMGRVFLAYSSYENEPYQSVRAKGLYADSELNLSALGEVGSLYEGAYISMDAGPVVTASFPDDRFYVQSDRSFGIGIKSTLASGVSHGDQVSFTGRLKKLDGETVIEASEVLTHGSGSPEPGPLGMTGRDLGGTAPSPAFYTVDGARGLYNIGLLVTVWGRVTGSGIGCIYLDDGSGIQTDGHAGIKVYGVPMVSTFVEVTGISGSELSGDKVIRVIRATGYRSLEAGGYDPPPGLPF